MREELTRSHQAEIEPTSAAPAQARRALRELFATSDGPWLDDAELVLSELVANAVEHGQGTLGLNIAADGDDITLEVSSDATDEVPTVLAVTVDEPHGRGLRIVAGLAQSWGHVLQGGRRTVWVVLSGPESLR